MVLFPVVALISPQSEMGFPRSTTRKRLPFTDTRGAAVILHSSAATFDRSQPRQTSLCLSCLLRFLVPRRSLCTMCWISFLYSSACILSWQHYARTHTHKHNHRQRCNLLCNFFLLTPRALLSSKTYFSKKNKLNSIFHILPKFISCFIAANPI